MNVFNVRAFTAPFPNLSDLSFEAEYAHEWNGELMHSTAYSAQGAYQFSKVKWKPKFSDRYAYFEGDDPRTHVNEAFDPLYLGFYDWATWWQGEIAGEYFLSNSNNISPWPCCRLPNTPVGSRRFALDLRHQLLRCSRRSYRPHRAETPHLFANDAPWVQLTRQQPHDALMKLTV